MPLQPGFRLGVFEILGPLGVGGMGEVYRARDTKLGREVAIKVLPAGFSSDSLRVARFEREARMLAAINHPAIAAIYGVEEAGDIPYIVMELVAGETLAEWIARGPLSLEESISFARQIAEALEAAHAQGVVHRDLKPSNIKITPDGRIKVLDLGLAKAVDEMPKGPVDPSQSPTVVLQDETRPGVILGTIEFMSPEQARGKEIDRRTDIWAFGCVLFEMLSGQRAFAGETISDILVAILTQPPDWSRLPRNTPPRLKQLIARCLEKDVDRRLSDLREARQELEQIAAEPRGPALREETRPRRPAQRRNAFLLGLAILFLLGAAWYGLYVSLPRAPAAPASRSLVVLPFRDLSGSADGQLLGDGLVETVSARLSRVPDLQIVTPSASVAASDRERDPMRIARALGANLVLRGAIQREGDRMRITYSVLQAPEGLQMSGDDVTGSSSNLFALQDELTGKVAAALHPGSRLPRPLPSDLQTADQQERYVRALGHLQRYDKHASLAEATRILEELSEQAPASALVHAALGRACLRQYIDTHDKQWADRARTECQKAGELDSQLPEVHVTLGQLLTRTSQPVAAISEFQAALAQQPNSIDAVLGLAAAYEAAKRDSAAESSYRRALALQPSYWAGYNQLGAFYYRRGRYLEAAEMFQRVLTLTPDNLRAYNNLGAAYQHAGNYQKAREAFMSSARIEPNEGTYNNLGTLEFFLGNYREAAAAFERATQLGPRKALYWSNLGDAYRWMPDRRTQATPAYQHAIVLAREELATDSRRALAHAILGLCLAKTGQAADGFREVQRALDIEPSNPDWLYDAAVVSELRGNSDEAIEWIGRALAAGLDPTQIEREPEFQRLRSLKSFQEALQSAKGGSRKPS